MADPLGTVYVELKVKHRRALSQLVEGWSDAEKQALLDGDDSARQELIHAAQMLAMREADEVNVVVTDIRMRDGNTTEEVRS